MPKRRRQADPSNRGEDRHQRMGGTMDIVVGVIDRDQEETKQEGDRTDDRRKRLDDDAGGAGGGTSGTRAAAPRPPACTWWDTC